MDDQEQKKLLAYQKLVERLTPDSVLLSGYLRAFWVGGVICVIGHGISVFGAKVLHLSALTLPAFTSMAMVFLGTLLTGLGVYDKIGQYAGAGSIVPITGFANSVAASAMEFRREGLVLGVGAKLFTLAGPVIVYGSAASILTGLAYWAIGRWR
jgi:stage V sporulation protein AC